mmetsp:Transcript_17355/g.41653  ORF Transcript_17355/g.41653 Transcript_17355/m.41653 type:complete len:82 (-) Transcript_17355:18-263(-)
MAAAVFVISCAYNNIGSLLFDNNMFRHPLSKTLIRSRAGRFVKVQLDEIERRSRTPDKSVMTIGGMTMDNMMSMGDDTYDT